MKGFAGHAQVTAIFSSAIVAIVAIICYTAVVVHELHA